MCNCINFSNIYKSTYPLFKNAAFLLDAELAHELTINSMKLIGKILPNHEINKELQVQAMGLTFANPIGLAAGLDKNAEAISYFTHLPFGFVEIGTVTPLPQIGNEKPRLFRYPQEESLRNKMGFNNLGASKVLDNLQHSNRRGKIIGVNLGKNKLTPNEQAVLDYTNLYKIFCHDADYLVINVSSPNTPGLRDLLKDKGLREIFEGLDKERKNKKIPLLIKVSPDMEVEELLSTVALVNEFSLDGIIATNTTIMKERGDGGVSGKLLSQKSKIAREILLKEIKKTQSKAEVIGVGGISTFNDLMDFWQAGGKLAQIYTSFVYGGPPLIYSFESQLKAEYKKRGVFSFEEFLDSLSFISK